MDSPPNGLARGHRGIGIKGTQETWLHGFTRSALIGGTSEQGEVDMGKCDMPIRAVHEHNVLTLTILPLQAPQISKLFSSCKGGTGGQKKSKPPA